MGYFRAVVFVLAMGATFLVAVPLQWLARRRGWALQRRIQTGFCRMMCAIIGIRIDAIGALPGAGGRFVVSNHVSWTDVIALASVDPLVFLAKKEVARWPALGLLARLQGTVFVDRGDRRAIPQVNAALKAILREGRDVVVFAEGTSSDGSGVLRFNPSHFAMLSEMADEGDAPILAPAAIAYLDRDGQPIDVGWYGDMTFLPHLWMLMRRGDVVCRIAFGEAVEIGARDRKALAAAAEARVRDLLPVARRS